MIPVARNGRALEPIRSIIDPFRAGLRHGRLAAGVDAGFDIDLDAGVVRVRVLLALERLQMPDAILSSVVGDPRFLRLAQASSPFSLSYTHWVPSIGGEGTATCDR